MKIWSFILFMLTLISCQKQPKFTEVLTEHKSYNDFFILNDSIVALTDNNELVSIHPEAKSLTSISKNEVLVNFFDDGLFFIDSVAELNHLNSANKILIQISDSMDVLGLIRSGELEAYAITESALIRSSTGEVFSFKEAPLTNKQVFIGDTPPQSFTLDNEGNIWVGFNLSWV